MTKRCSWVNEANPLSVAYHDEEWGIPVHDDRHLFEMLCLEGAQAGLSWETILNKRRAYRRVFVNFDATRLARFTDQRLERCLRDPGIVRNRLKVWSVRDNARALLQVREEWGTLDRYLWQFVDGRPIRNRWRTLKMIPAKTDLSDRLSKELKHRGFRFVGSTICYAFMQAVGMVNDHTQECFRFGQDESAHAIPP